MTPEEKTLLLQDLCMRLPYDVKCNINGELCNIERIDIKRQQFYLKKDDKHGGTYSIARGDVIKPYLRPMSSMTDEEKKQYEKLTFFVECVVIDQPYDSVTLIDWLNKNHFDYHGLIKKGLALEAPEGMYND